MSRMRTSPHARPHTHSLRLLAIACASASLLACAPLPTQPTADATLVLPAQWAGVQVPAHSQITPQWWQQLGDARLDTLVQQALAHNHDILAAGARVQEAQAQLAATSAAAGPQISASAATSASRSLSPLGPTHTRSVQPGVQASWEWDLWGRLAAQQGAAHARVIASEADRAGVQLSVTTTTVRAYVGLRALQEQLRISEATALLRAKALELLQDQGRMGYIAQLPVRQAQAELAGVQQQVQQLHGQIAHHITALQVLLGQTEAPAALHTFTAADWQQLQLLPVPHSLPSHLLERRPDIARANALLTASDHALAAQRAAFLPQVGLSASVGSLLVNALDYHPLTVWSLGGSVLAPLFDSGLHQGQVDAVHAQRNQAAYAYRGVVLHALADVQNALTDSARLQSQAEHARTRHAALQDAEQLAHDRYRTGYASYLEALDAQRNRYAAQLDVVRLQQAQLENRVQLYQALGGGWQQTQP